MFQAEGQVVHPQISLLLIEIRFIFRKFPDQPWDQASVEKVSTNNDQDNRGQGIREAVYITSFYSTVIPRSQNPNTEDHFDGCQESRLYFHLLLSGSGEHIQHTTPRPIVRENKPENKASKAYIFPILLLSSPIKI